MSLFTRLVGKSISVYWKKNRKAYVIAVAVLVVLAVLNYFVNNYTDNIVGTIIKNAVSNETGGLYNADFDDIGLIVNDGSIYLKNFSINFDSSALASADTAQLNSLKYVYWTKVPNFYLNVSNLFALYFHRELHVQGVKVDHPNFHVLAFKDSTVNRKFTLEVGNAYNLISGYLKVFSVNDFDLNDGEFFFDEYQGQEYDNFHVKDISIKIKNFLLDKNTSLVKDKFFFTDQVEINIKNQEILLKDKLHKVTFDNFFLSTVSSEVVIDNFRVYRLKSQFSSDTLDFYDIHIPQFKLTGVDFFKAYNDNVLNISSIEFNNPELNLSFYADGNNRENLENSFVNLAMLYFDQWHVKHFMLEDAKLTLRTNENNATTKNSFDNIYAQISNFSIDTVNQVSEKRKYNYQDINLAVRNYEFILPDSIHVLSAKEIGINSKPSQIYLKNFSIHPRQDVDIVEQLKRNHQFETYDFQLKYGVVSNVDFSKILNTDTISLKEVNLDSPQFVFHQYPLLAHEPGSNGVVFDPFNPYPIIQRITNAVYLQKLIVHQGAFHWIEKNSSADTIALANNLNIDLESVRLDSLTGRQTNLLGAQKSTLTANTIHYQNKTVDGVLSNVSFHAGKKIDIRATKFSLRNKTDSTSEGELPEFALLSQRFSISGMELDQLLKKNHVVADSLQLTNALIDVNLQTIGSTKKKQAGKKDSIRWLDLGHFHLQHSGIRLSIDNKTNIRSDSLELSLNSIHFDTLSHHRLIPLQFGQISAICHNLRYYPEDGVNYINIESIVANSQDSLIDMHNFQMRPILLNPLLQNQGENIDIKVPEIKVTGFDLSRLMDHLAFRSRELSVMQPYINATFRTNGHRQTETTPLSMEYMIQFIKPLASFRTQWINIIGGNYTIAVQSPTDKFNLESRNLHITISGFDLNDHSSHEKKLFYANDYDLTGDYLSMVRHKEADYSGINHFALNTGQKTFSASGLYYSKNIDNPKSNQYKLYLDQLDLDGLDYRSLFDQKIINLNNANLSGADIDAVIYLGRQGKNSWQFLNKNPIDSSVIAGMNVGAFHFNKGKANLKFIKNDVSSTLNMPEINILAKNVNLDPKLAVKSQRLGFSDEVQLDFINPNYTFNRNLQVLNIDHLMINLPDSLIIANNFSLIPQKEKYDFAPEIGYQTDWIKIENKEIRLEKIDFNKLVLQRIVEAQKLIIDNLDVSVFRDKRLKPAPNIYKKLPQERLLELPFPVRLDSVELHDADVVYQEQAEKAVSPGEVYFTHLNAKAGNITNEQKNIASNPHCRLQANAYVMDKGYIQAAFDFDLSDKNYKHQFGATIDQFDLDEFNRILSPNAFVKIKSGVNEKIILNVQANNDYSMGSMKFYYNNLKIALLNKNTETPKGVGKAIGSFFANTFIINTNNPHLVFVKKGNIFFERDKSKSIFNYWSKTFLSGVVSSIGAKNNKKEIRRYEDENPDNKKVIKQDSITTLNIKK